MCNMRVLSKAGLKIIWKSLTKYIMWIQIYLNARNYVLDRKKETCFDLR